MTRLAAGHNDQIASGAWANWLWLADPPSHRAALSLDPHHGTATALTRYFDRVEQDELGSSFVESSWTPEMFDLVVVGCVTNHGVSNTISESLWSDCHRVLRVGGCLMVADENPLWYRQRRFGIALINSTRRVRRQRRAIRAAGFKHVRRYYLAPSYQDPHTIVPINRRIITGYEQVEMKLATRGALRSRLSRLGLHAALYPLILSLAYR